MTHTLNTALFSVENLAHNYFTSQAQFFAPTLSDLHSFSLQMESLDKASGIVVAIFVVQALFLLLRTALGDLTGPYKMLILSFLAVIVTVGEKYARGEPLIMVFGDATSLMAYQVLLHQAVKHYKELKNGRSKEISDFPVSESRNCRCSDGFYHSTNGVSGLHTEDSEVRPAPFRD